MVASLGDRAFMKIELHAGAHNRIRTGGLFLTKEVLYQLSYVSK